MASASLAPLNTAATVPIILKSASPAVRRQAGAQRRARASGQHRSNQLTPCAAAADGHWLSGGVCTPCKDKRCLWCKEDKKAPGTERCGQCGGRGRRRRGGRRRARRCMAPPLPCPLAQCLRPRLLQRTATGPGRTPASQSSQTAPRPSPAARMAAAGTISWRKACTHAAPARVRPGPGGGGWRAQQVHACSFARSAQAPEPCHPRLPPCRSGLLPPAGPEGMRLWWLWRRRPLPAGPAPPPAAQAAPPVLRAMRPACRRLLAPLLAFVCFPLCPCLLFASMHEPENLHPHLHGCRCHAAQHALVIFIRLPLS